MKIKERNNKHLTWIGKEVKCSSCESVFILEEKDKRKVRELPAPRPPYDDMDGKYYDFSAKCPVCGEDCEFDAD